MSSPDPSEMVGEDRAELELRERLTLAETALERLNTTVGLIALGLVALVVAHVALMAIVKRGAGR